MGKEVFKDYKVGDKIVVTAKKRPDYFNQEGFMDKYLDRKQILIVKRVLGDCVFVEDGWYFKFKDIELYEPEKTLKKPSFLPLEVIFNPKKGRTTLVFSGYETSVAQTSHGDKFDKFVGLYLAWYKKLNPHYKRELDYRYYEIDNFKKDGWNVDGVLNEALWTSLSRELLNSKVLSFTQIFKISTWYLDKDLTLTLLDGTKHTIKVRTKE